MTKRTILVAGVPPCLNYSGGLFLHGIIEAASIRPAGIFVVQNPALSPAVAEEIRRAIPIRTVDRPKDWYDLDETGVREAELAARERRLPAILAELMDFAEEMDATDFWTVLEGQTLIRLAHALSERDPRPLRVQVMDPPGWWLRGNNVDPETTGEVLGQFDEVLRRARSCAAASWSMAALYRDRYGVPALPVVPSLPASLARPPASAPSREGPIRIGMAGQRYAEAECAALIEAVALSARSGGRPFELHVYAADRPPCPPEIDHLVRHHGWLDQRSLLRGLSALDLLYCPYWFDPAFREEALLCFPSKLTSYLATGVPVLLHARADSSPARFLRSGAGAFFCFRLDPAALARTIAGAVGSPLRYAAHARNGRALFDRFLTGELLRSSVDEFLLS